MPQAAASKWPVFQRCVLFCGLSKWGTRGWWGSYLSTLMPMLILILESTGRSLKGRGDVSSKRGIGLNSEESSEDQIHLSVARKETLDGFSSLFVWLKTSLIILWCLPHWIFMIILGNSKNWCCQRFKPDLIKSQPCRFGWPTFSPYWKGVGGFDRVFAPSIAAPSDAKPPQWRQDTSRSWFRNRARPTTFTYHKTYL